MQTTAVSESGQTGQPPLVPEAALEGGGLSPLRSLLPAWVKGAADQISRIRLPRMVGHRPEEVILTLHSDASSAPPQELQTDKPPTRRQATLPRNGRRAEFGAQLAQGQPALAADVDVSTNTMRSQAAEGVAETPPPEDFEVESLRFQTMQLVSYKKVLGKPAYLVDELEAHLVHPGTAGHHRMVARDLATRFSSGGKEKPVDAVVCYNDPLAHGPRFAHSLVEALVQEYGATHEIAIHILAKKLSSDEQNEEYQLAGKWNASQHPLSGKRVLLAVPSITPHSWPSVSRQALYLRGCAAWIRVVSIARVGKLPAQGRAGILIESFTSYGG